MMSQNTATASSDDIPFQERYGVAPSIDLNKDGEAKYVISLTCIVGTKKLTVFIE
jgi:outer membrane receptor for monomeric catechols